MPKFASAVQLAEQSSPADPPSGWASLFAKAGGALWFRTAAGVERPVHPGTVFAFSRAGTLTAGVGTHRLYNDTGSPLSIRAVRASVGTAPAGSAVVVDVNVDGVTIFSVQGNRPTVAAGANTSGKAAGMSTTVVADGSYFTVDVDQVGSSAAGADLTVQILC